MPQTLIGTNLRRLRESARLTQRDLAELSGIDDAHIARIECGLTLDPRVSTLQRLQPHLGANIEDFYTPIHHETSDAHHNRPGDD